MLGSGFIKLSINPDTRIDASEYKILRFLSNTYREKFYDFLNL